MGGVNPELWHRAAPILPTHDVAVSGGFLGALGFALRLFDAEYLIATLGETELHYARTPGIDPFASVGSAYLHVTNADLLHADLYAVDVMPDLTELGVGDEGELRARWASDRDVSRLGVVHDTDRGTREFALFDPTNNLLVCGSPA